LLSSHIYNNKLELKESQPRKSEEIGRGTGEEKARKSVVVNLSLSR
jgi:hypothetical protein